MNKALIIGGIVLVAGVAIVAISYISAANLGNRSEVTIKTRYDNAKQVMSRVSNSILEAAQVPEMAKNDVIDAINAATAGRYGEGGANNVVLSIQENNPGTIDPSLYTRIQDLIASGRTDFSNEQKILLDTKAAYEISLGSFWTGMWLGVAGYPRIDLADYNIVTSEIAEQAFSSGRDQPLQLGN